MCGGFEDKEIQVSSDLILMNEGVRQLADKLIIAWSLFYT